jgi:hypothetical protein
MKLFKCIFNSGGTYLTINKIYQVKRKIISDGQTYIEIETDKGVELLYNIDSITTIFIDIQKLRDNKLNELGI